jgi:hypothetical protein
VISENIVEFDPVRHIYRHVVTGRRIPSVTEILRVTGIRPPPVNRPHAEAVARAMQRGTEVHRLTREIDESGFSDDAADDEFDPADIGVENINYVSAYQRFLETSGYIPTAWETVSWLPGYNVAGRMDMVGWLGSKRVLIDRKTGSVHRATWLQLAAYKKMHDFWHPSELIDQTYALLLSADMSFRLLPNPVEETAFSYFAGAVWVYQWNRLAL